MSHTFTREQIESIAALAHLRLDEGEIEQYGRQLAEILSYAEQVQQIDTTAVPPTEGMLARGGTDRPDVVTPSLDRANALANGPDASVEAGLFRVPRVIA
jgi:aspartyl-tRNA(Asn)/glutamyl-tRNA(Gln) amidotransferase subunit C